MYIHKIRINNFKSFRQETEINFDDFKGLYKLTGQIGSGKTTIGEAIIFGLFGGISGKNNVDLISWGEKHALVEVWYECHGHNIYISRQINTYGQNPLTVLIDDEPMIATNKRGTQQQLEAEHMDVTRTTMELLCVISFNSFTSLSTLNARDTKDFLDYVLGFDVLTSYVDKCKEFQSEIKTELARLDAERRAIEKQIERLSQPRVLIDDNSGTLTEEIEELNTNIKNVTKESGRLINEQKDEISKLRVSLGEVKSAGGAVAKEIKFIKQGVCPVCGAPIDQSSLATKETERKILLERYAEIDALIRTKTAQISLAQEEMTKSIDELKNAVKSREIQLTQIREQKKYTVLDEGEREKLRSDVDAINEQMTRLNIQNTGYARLIDVFTNVIHPKVLESFIIPLNKQIRTIAEMLQLQYVPEFDTAFKCTILSNGIQQIPTSSLSTGQLKLVDMVIILAVLNSVMLKAKSNIIFLDELFSNLDPSTRIELLLVLKKIIPEGDSVFIVTHQEIDNDMFAGNIKMRLEKTESGLCSVLSPVQFKWVV